MTPPRFTSLIARLAVRREVWRDDVLGDVAEEFAERAAADGPAAATRWYRRETARLAGDAARRRLRGALAALGVLFFIGDRPMNALSGELRAALRALTRRPGVTAAILLTLAIGLGVNAAIFDSIDSLMLKPFAFKDIDRLVMVTELSDSDPYPKENVSPANFVDFTRDVTTVTGLAAYEWSELNLAGGDRPERVAGFAVSANFFSTLGVAPAMGRFFTPESHVRGGHHEAVISDRLWRNQFGAAANIIGREVHIDGEPAQVVGVAPADFAFPDGADAWTPLAFEPKEAANRASHYLTVFGRLTDGHSIKDAEAELGNMYSRLLSEHSDDLRGRKVVVMSLTSGMIDVGLPTILMMWQAAAAFVLLIGCTNVINLLLAQGAERQRELAIRLAIGASRIRIVRQLLVENLTLSLAAVPGALAVAWLTLKLMTAAMPPALIRFVPGWDRMHVDGPLMAWTILGAAITGVLFGLLPAIHASRASVLSAVKSGGDGGRTQTAGQGRNRARRILVVAELALALPLLVASAMAVSGVQKFVTGNQGYDPNGVLRASVVLPEAQYKDDAALRLFADRLLDEVGRIPSITAAATGSLLPASGSNRSSDLEIEGRPVDKDNPITVNFRIVSPQYFDALRIPIRSGRAFGSLDRENGQRVAIISESLASRYFNGDNPIGRRMKIRRIESDWVTIAGVSGDIIDDWFANRNVPTIYVPEAQTPTRSVNLIARTAGDPAGLEADIRRALANVDANVPAYQVRTMTNALKERTTGLRFIGGLMAAFGIIALVLAAIGIYSVMAFYVTLRRKEMGLRLALGATPGDVLRMTLGQASRLSLIGVAIGTVAAIALARVIEQALLGVATASPLLFATVGVTLFAIASLASFMPAREATKVNPAATLRD
ncbi:MAG: ABC transporter permease [Acidobacteria bacterium]|nr:MAG: ABC transporter permease [Acidobacteriota bacterium]